MSQGSPSRLRRPETVIRTALVNGSAFLIPRSFEQVFSTHHATLSRHKHLEHSELLPSQGNVPTLSIHLASKWV